MTRSTTDPIEYLVLCKFPQARELRIPPSLSSFPSQAMSGQDRERLRREVTAYREELTAKTPEEIAALVENEKAKEASFWQARVKREEEERFFNRPNARADFGYWSKAPYWKLDEALALAFGKAPEAVSWDSVKPLVNVSAFARSFSRFRELAIRAKNFKLLTDPVVPGDFLAWAKQVGIDVSSDLVDQVEAAGHLVVDWKEVIGTLKTERDMLLEDRDKIARVAERLISDRNTLRARVVELEEQISGWQFDDSAEDYPAELDMAMQAWRAVSKQRDPSMTVKQQLQAWLDQHYPKVSDEAKERVATICNWAKKGGRPQQGPK